MVLTLMDRIKVRLKLIQSIEERFFIVIDLVCLLFYLHCFSHAEYLTKVDLEEKKESQEMNARQEFDKGEGKAIAVPQLLEKLSRPGQMPFYYCGGLEILSQAVTDCECSFGRCLVQLSFSSNLFVPSLSLITCFTGSPIWLK